MTVLTNENFDESIKSGLVMVDFFADWCGPCHALAPTIDSLAEKYEGKIKVYKLDVDAAGAIAERYNVMSIPTVMFFKDGKEVNKLVGANPESRYTDVLEKLLK
jgi:thioredoxin 1